MAYQDISNREETRKLFWPRIPQQNVLFERKEVEIYDISRRQIGDLYCVVCDSKMDTKIMWENHIKGNSHFRNSLNFEYSNEEPTVQEELDRETRPIVGLNYICEILCINRIAVYQCLLCPAGLTTSNLLMEHIMGLQHQMAFLKEHVKEKFSLVNSSALSKSDLESVVQNIISKYEQEYGRGEMLVKKEKRHANYISFKKFYDDDGGRRPFRKSARYFPPPKFSRYSPSNSTRMKELQLESEWKALPVRERSRELLYYSDAKMWESIEPNSTFYRREPTHLEIQNSKSQQDNCYSPAYPSLYEGDDRRDIRPFLEQKKNLGTNLSDAKANIDGPACVPFSSEINDDPDILLRLIDDTSPELFLRLALFKLDNMDIKEEIELKLLDRVVNKATALALNVKKILAQNLKAEYKDTFDPNSISPQDCTMMDTSTQNNVQITQDIDNLIGHYKARKTTVYEDVCFQESYSGHLKSSEPMSRHKLNNVFPYQNTPEIAIIYDSAWNRRQSNS